MQTRQTTHEHARDYDIETYILYICPGTVDWGGLIVSIGHESASVELLVY